ncbi:uncharacterized protein EDB93DRAFT_1106362 [Suillus bovinus]|uniref:uncharacterized protein n=1 Tax=Suillus bovinus TaxID=48563 RepID=UPI001B86A5A0|nr:uncharacterized protein EDB93DRAFT_1106362 [Suillus bovinus]KAG2138395.1 hypothetical protein EDB93DRAFT_1106362 [Suillus bovinus]
MAPSFSVQNLVALRISAFAESYSNSEHQAAARALLRHNVHLDGTHYHTRKPGSLRPSYVAFNSFPIMKQHSLTCEELVEASLQDVFDSIQLITPADCYAGRRLLCRTEIAMQDRLDRGISVLIRCPGFNANTALSPGDVAVDLYITPQELQENSAFLVQVFCEEFVVPHMERFMKCCHIEGVKPPHRFVSARINLSGPPHLPAPSVATGARIQCSGYLKEAFKRELSFGSKEPSSLPASAAICHATAPVSMA